MIITVNNRLARELRQRYDQQQATETQHVWQSAEILPWSAWLQQGYTALVDQGLVTRVLMHNHQERLLWQQIVQADANLWLRPQAAASLAQQAWKLMCEWQLDLATVQAMATEESRCFLTWQATFQHRCLAEGWLTLAELPSLFIEHLTALDKPGQIKLCGFDDLCPQQHQLFDQLRELGVSVEPLPAPDSVSQAQLVQAVSPQEEMRAAAVWAQQRLLEEPNQRIAIISPQLQQQRQALEHILREYISPQSLLPGGPVETGFNLSLGRPLADMPLIAQLLLVLDATRQQPITAQDASSLLRAPCLADPTEWSQRAALDRRLQEDGLPYNLARMVRRARAIGADNLLCHAPHFVSCLSQLQQQVALWPRLATPTYWAAQIGTLIDDCLEWPGPQLNSVEYQQVARFRHLLGEFASLELVQPAMRWTEALGALRQLCVQSIFQPETEDHRLQILGVLDAVGLTFDAVWLLGMDDSCWPPAANPHPLLPVSLQRELGMPHASSARELAFAQKLSLRLGQIAPMMWVSYAAQVDDRVQRISPLFADIPACVPETADLSSALTQAAQALGPCDRLPTPEAVPPTQPPGGGSHLLNAQAACPFQAMARYRLGARAWPTVQYAPDARLNGQLLHTVLQQVWAELQDSTQLQATSEERLRALVADKAGQALQDVSTQRPDIYTEPFIELEIQRMVTLVLAWLDLEKQRTLPFRVQQLEERRDLMLNGLPLHLQTDRVDSLESGEQVVIDYKSGQMRQPDWAETRPTELQVPLYCIQADRPVAGLLGQVNSQRTAFRGMAEQADIAPGISAFQATETVRDWPDLMSHWQAVLTSLSAEIQAGQAEVAPRDALACERCGLQSLCRVEATVG